MSIDVIQRVITFEESIFNKRAAPRNVLDVAKRIKPRAASARKTRMVTDNRTSANDDVRSVVEQATTPPVTDVVSNRAVLKQSRTRRRARGIAAMSRPNAATLLLRFVVCDRSVTNRRVAALDQQSPATKVAVIVSNRTAVDQGLIRVNVDRTMMQRPVVLDDAITNRGTTRKAHLRTEADVDSRTLVGYHSRRTRAVGVTSRHRKPIEHNARRVRIVVENNVVAVVGSIHKLSRVVSAEVTA